jgi:hypothetical protein
MGKSIVTIQKSKFNKDYEKIMELLKLDGKLQNCLDHKYIAGNHIH